MNENGNPGYKFNKFVKKYKLYTLKDKGHKNGLDHFRMFLLDIREYILHLTCKDRLRKHIILLIEKARKKFGIGHKLK
jgi:hypothetical protein